MANVLVAREALEDIADAIRAKTGSENTYKPRQMAEAISNISGGGTTPTGTINITSNGTHDVTNYASANVNVPTGGSTPTGTKQISITANGITTEDVANYANAEITVNGPTGGGSDSGLELLQELVLSEATRTVAFDKSNWSEYKTLFIVTDLTTSGSDYIYATVSTSNSANTSGNNYTDTLTSWKGLLFCVSKVAENKWWQTLYRASSNVNITTVQVTDYSTKNYIVLNLYSTSKTFSVGSSFKVYGIK